MGQRARQEIERQVRRVLQRVDDGIPGHVDCFSRHAFLEEVVPRGFGRGKMEIGHDAGHPPVDFLRIRLVFLVAAQPCFDVPHADAMVKRNQRRGEHGRGIALNEQPVRSFAPNDFIQPGECRGGDLGQGLIFAHQVEIVIRADFEQP